MPRWLEHKIPPPVIDAALAALMWALARTLPGAQLWPPGNHAWVWTAAIALALTGCCIALAGVWALTHARTTVNPLTPQRTSALVTHGIYRHSRNPMYLGMLLALAGWGAWLGNAATWLALPLSVALIHHLQIVPEERALRQHFGPAFDAWAARVRRWL